MQWWQFCGKVRMQVMWLYIHCTVKYSTKFHTKSVASSYLIGFPADGIYLCSSPATRTPKHEKYPYFLLEYLITRNSIPGKKNMLSAHTGETHIHVFVQNVSIFILRILHIQKFKAYVTITTTKTSNVFHTT